MNKDIDLIIDELLIERGEHPSRVRNPIYSEERELAKKAVQRILSPSPMEGKTPLKGWVNVYKRLDNEFNEELCAGAVHDTILDSKLNRHENCIACIDLSKHYEGEGL